MIDHATKTAARRASAERKAAAAAESPATCPAHPGEAPISVPCCIIAGGAASAYHLICPECFREVAPCGRTH